MASVGKRLKSAYEAIDAEKLYSVDEALKIVQDAPKAKFAETLDVAINLNVDPRHADQMVRGVTSLPAGTGKEIRVAVFAADDKAIEAKDAGADLVGAEDLIDIVKSGKIEFDRCIATPDMMPKLGAAARILGPKGLMPNPKLGTVTKDVAKAVKDAKAGQVEYKTDKNGVIHAGVGKVTFSYEDLKKNLLSFINAIIAAKPSGAKGTYILKIVISSTMGAPLKLDITSAIADAAAIK